MNIFLILITACLSGCGAIYQYERTAESCSLSIYSARDVKAVDLKIGKNCTITGGAESLTSNEKALDAINSLVNKIP